MKKRMLENKIFEKSDKALLKFLEKNFSAQKVSDIELKKKLITYESLDEYYKRVINARLNAMDESHDLTTIFVGLVAITIGFLSAYGIFIKLIMLHELYATITILLSYVIALFIFAINLGMAKGNRAKVKYLQSLFKKD